MAAVVIPAEILMAIYGVLVLMILGKRMINIIALITGYSTTWNLGWAGIFSR